MFAIVFCFMLVRSHIGWRGERNIPYKSVDGNLFLADAF